MPRATRITYPGAYYHVYARGNRKADVFRSDNDRRLFLAQLREACMEFSLRCLAYCLMSNHYHLVLRNDQTFLSPGMQKLNARYAEHFNLAYDLTGHVFQGRFQAKLIGNEAQLLRTLRYVVKNPVAARLCFRASEWQWSSYSAVLGERAHTEWFDRAAVLSLFATEPGLAISRYIEFVAQETPTERPTNTLSRSARLERDLAIRAARSTSGLSVRALAKMFGVSVGTVVNALKCSTGSDPVEH